MTDMRQERRGTDGKVGEREKGPRGGEAMRGKRERGAISGVEKLIPGR